MTQNCSKKIGKYNVWSLAARFTSENDNEVIIGTRLLPTNSKSYDINKFSIKMNDILRKMVQYSASDDPFILDLDK